MNKFQWKWVSVVSKSHFITEDQGLWAGKLVELQMIYDEYAITANLL